MSEGFVVEIKPSARRTNGAVGTAVNREGTRPRFDGREAADAWATDLATRGERPVWIRAANPNDERDIDAYLMGRRRGVTRGKSGAVGAQSAVRSYASADDAYTSAEDAYRDDE